MPLLKVYEVFTPRTKGAKESPTRVLHTGTAKEVAQELRKSGYPVAPDNIRYSHFVKEK